MTQQSAGAKTITLADGTPTWFPANKPLDGTISTVNTRVTGTDTKFLSQINMGDYLVDENNIARKVLDVISDTDLIISSAFPSDLTDEECSRLFDKVLRRLEVVFITNAGKVRNADQDVDGDWPAGTPPWESSSGLYNYLTPILVTPGAAGARVIEVI